MEIYGKRLLQFNTFLIPYALVQYYPLLYLLDKKTAPLYSLTPLFVFLFLIPSYLIWKYGVHHYQSTGHNSYKG
nr:ABC-2 family transporter protein [uncultured Lachnoclostridium sp.]